MSNYILDDKEEVRMAELKDSGERKIFETGATRDISKGKGRCDLLPLDTIVYILDLDGNKRRILECINDFLKTGHIAHLKYAILIFNAEKNNDLVNLLLDLSIHYEDGARKYEPNNWKKGIPVHCFIDSGLRHYFKWLRGDEDEPHDRAFVWNLVGAIWTMENKPEFNDISGY